MVGGFTNSFTLAERDTEVHPTRLLAIDDPGTPNDPALVVLGPGAVGVPATLHLEGTGGHVIAYLFGRDGPPTSVMVDFAKRWLAPIKP